MSLMMWLGSRRHLCLGVLDMFKTQKQRPSVHIPNSARAGALRRSARKASVDYLLRIYYDPVDVLGLSVFYYVLEFLGPSFRRVQG